MSYRALAGSQKPDQKENRYESNVASIIDTKLTAGGVSTAKVPEQCKTFYCIIMIILYQHNCA